MGTASSEMLNLDIGEQSANTRRCDGTTLCNLEGMGCVNEGAGGGGQAERLQLRINRRMVNRMGFFNQ